MITFKGENKDGKKLVGVSISKQDYQKLRECGHVKVDLERLGFPKMELLLYYGSDKDISMLLRKQGFGSEAPKPKLITKLSDSAKALFSKKTVVDTQK